MLTHWVTKGDIQAWKALSREYDQYISDVVTNLSTWYEGFDEYMNRKIEQKEAIIAIDKISKNCNGIIAFSRGNNRITFFAVCREANYAKTAEKLITVTIQQLNPNRDILVLLPKSNNLQLKTDQDFFYDHGFEFVKDSNIDGCPMVELARKGRE